MIIGLIYVLAGCFDLHGLNLKGAKDVETIGIVASKFSSRTGKSITRRFGVIYKVDPSLNATPKVSQSNREIRIARLNGNKMDLETFTKLAKKYKTLNKHKMEDLQYAYVTVKSGHYWSTKLYTDIKLFYRSHRPWFPALSPEVSKAKAHIKLGLIFISLSAIGFFLSRRGHAL